MKTKTLMPMLAFLLALPAAARDFGSVFAEPLPLVAQMSQEERRLLRERWEQASPEERAELRRAFQERLRRMPAESFDPRRMDMKPFWADPRDKADPTRTYQPDNGYGTGYERRRHEEKETYEPLEDASDYRSRGKGRR
jgi:hypothetical protein